MKAQADALQFCQEQASELVGIDNDASSEWTRLVADIRDDGLEHVVTHCHTFLEHARNDRNSQVTHNTAVPQAFLDFIDTE